MAQTECSLSVAFPLSLLFLLAFLQHSSCLQPSLFVAIVGGHYEQVSDLLSVAIITAAIAHAA
jgi:hypothetical protein